MFSGSFRPYRGMCWDKADSRSRTAARMGRNKAEAEGTTREVMAEAP